jgi:hypothetical protein
VIKLAYARGGDREGEVSGKLIEFSRSHRSKSTPRHAAAQGKILSALRNAADSHGHNLANQYAAGKDEKSSLSRE